MLVGGLRPIVFQSPLHRGSLFNLVLQTSHVPSDLISVPSSSGKSLQPDILEELVDLGVDFSPLFIGEVSSTRSIRALFSAGYKADQPEFLENPLFAENLGRFAKFRIPTPLLLCV